MATSSGVVLEWLVTGALAVAAARPTWSVLRKLGDDAERARAEARDEYDVRVCARLAAASRNLADAASWIGEREPRLRDEARRVARETVARLEERYGPRPVRYGDDVCSGSRLAAYLRREETEGRDATWPNWVVAFRAPSE